MLYNLQFVPNHPVYRLTEAVGFFLERGLNQSRFTDACYPVWFVPVVDASDRLKSKFRKVFRKARASTQGVRDSVWRVWRGTRDIQTLCENNRTRIQTWGFNDDELCQALADLFDFLYEDTLKKSATFSTVVGRSLQHHYDSFIGLGQIVCPFCGISEYVDPESGSRSGYDHFLTRKYYPLAAVDFRNLVPMCDSCNEPPGKGAKDVLFSDPERTRRRKFYYPFGTNGGFSLETVCTRRPILGDQGAWRVRIRARRNAERAQVTAWVSVFGIDARYPARIRQGVDGWVKNFLNTKQYAARPTVLQLRRAFATKAGWLAQPEQSRTVAQAVLQAAAFRYLATRAPNDMVAGWADIAVSPAVKGTPVTLN